MKVSFEPELDPVLPDPAEPGKNRIHIRLRFKRHGSIQALDQRQWTKSDIKSYVNVVPGGSVPVSPCAPPYLDTWVQDEPLNGNAKGIRAELTAHFKKVEHRFVNRLLNTNKNFRSWTSDQRNSNKCVFPIFSSSVIWQYCWKMFFLRSVAWEPFVWVLLVMAVCLHYILLLHI